MEVPVGTVAGLGGKRFSMAETILRVESLGKTYRSGAMDLTVFSALNLELYFGESVAVIGESGAGKSTLLHLLGALDRPTAGEIYFESQPLSGRSYTELAGIRNRKIGFVWQSYYLQPEFTALENVMMPLLIAETARREAESQARPWLERVGLADRASHRAGELSGGEQQRVTIARALVTEPKLVLADEPTGNLDADNAEAIMGLLVGLPRAQKLTVVIATHSPTLARRCDRVFRIDSGQIQALDL